MTMIMMKIMTMMIPNTILKFHSNPHHQLKLRIERQEIPNKNLKKKYK